MLDENDNNSAETPAKTTTTTTTTSSTRRRAAGRPAGPPAALTNDPFSAPAAAPPAKKKTAPKAKAGQPKADQAEPAPKTKVEAAPKADKPAKAAPKQKPVAEKPVADTPDVEAAETKPAAKKAPARKSAPKAALVDIFAAPDLTAAPPRKRAPKPAAADDQGTAKSNTAKSNNAKSNNANSKDSEQNDSDANNSGNGEQDHDDDFDDDGAPRRRRRSRGGRRRRRSDEGDDSHDSNHDSDSNESDDHEQSDEDGNQSLRRRRRRRAGEDSGTSPDDPQNTTVRVREPRSAEDEITGVTGSTRLEAKKQRRREGREAGRRRAPIVSEAEFLARRESVKREMAIRQHTDYSQIAVLEDNVLVEHYVARESQVSLIGNVYLGRVQNVLPSMEAAFVDIGKGRNAVLYAGEVDWSTLGNGKQRKIEDVLSSGQTVLVQVTKDPIGQKGARLTSQISLAGRFLVYVPGGQTSGISRKLPDTERARLKALLKEVLPEDAGVIVRTAAEGATEDQLTRDVSALTARWEDIQRKVEAGNSPELLYSEPDLMIKVVRDLFNEDFGRLVVEGDDAWDMVSGYINHVAPDLIDRLERWNNTDKDVFASLRVDEQIAKALDRKVFLPSGGSLVIDRTEAMTVVDVNTGKFTGSGGNLEETVTKNNLEAAEEVVRQLRLRDIGGIIVIDFIDMVLENNRDLVLRRLVECLGRDRTRHQVAEVTSLGLIQMTRKRIGTGLLETFGVDCDHCHGRGVVVEAEPIEPKVHDDNNHRRNRRGGRNNNSDGHGNNNSGNNNSGNNSGNKNKDQGAKDQGTKDQGKPEKAETDSSATDDAATESSADKKSGGSTGRARAQKRPAAKPEEMPADKLADGAESVRQEAPAAIDASKSDVTTAGNDTAGNDTAGGARAAEGATVAAPAAPGAEAVTPKKDPTAGPQQTELPPKTGPVLTSEGLAP